MTPEEFVKRCSGCGEPDEVISELVLKYDVADPKLQNAARRVIDASHELWSALETIGFEEG